MIRCANFRQSGSSVRCIMGGCHRKALIRRVVICLASNRASLYLSGAIMRGLLRLLVEAEPMITITDFLVIRSEIPMIAVGSSGTVVIGWGGVCQSWILYRSNGGDRFADTPAASERAVNHMTCFAVHVNDRRCCSGRIIRLSKRLFERGGIIDDVDIEPKIIPLETQS